MPPNSLNQALPASIPPESREARTLERLRRLSFWMDEAIRIPILGWRVGLQPIIGIVPVIGDLIGLVLTGYLVQQAWAIGAPRGLIVRMGINTLIDFVIGLLPGLGDAADAVYKANSRNLRLLERHLAARLAPPKPRRRWTAWLLWAGLFGIGVLLLVLPLRWLFGG